jgi:hypothetical protein
MALLESLLWMAAQTVGATPPAKADPPPLELLEFLADWTDEDGKLIDKEKPAEKGDAKRKRRERGDRDTGGTTP